MHYHKQYNGMPPDALSQTISYRMPSDALSQTISYRMPSDALSQTISYRMPSDALSQKVFNAMGCHVSGMVLHCIDSDLCLFAFF